MRTRNRAPQEKMPDEELSRRILFYGHLANLCAYGCIAGAVLGFLAGILLQSFTAGCTIVMLVIVAAVFLIQLIHAMQSSLILGQLEMVLWPHCTRPLARSRSTGSGP